MNNLSLYIKEALEGKDEIYLSGIGTFKKERVPAYFDELKKQFFPPTLTIALKLELVSNSSLAQFWAKKENISLDDAQERIEEAVATINEQEKTSLEGLGTLRKVNGVYEFIYAPSVINEGFDAYEPISEGAILEPLEEVVEEKEEEVVLPVLEPVIEDTQEEKASSNRWLWPSIGAVACLILVGIWILQSANRDKQLVEPKPVEAVQSAEINPLEDTTQMTTANLDSPGTTETLLQDSTVLDSASKSNEEVVSKLVKVPEGRFEIIIAAFNTIQEAEEYVTNTNAKGYDVYILKNNRSSNFKKISYATYQTEQEATKALVKVRKELNPDAWIWENKRVKNNN